MSSSSKEEPSVDVEMSQELPDGKSSDSTILTRAASLELTPSRYSVCMNDYGHKLFDVLSRDTLITWIDQMLVTILIMTTILISKEQERRLLNVEPFAKKV